MKKYIKKLLGITDLEDAVEKLPSNLEKLVRDAFSGDVAVYSKYSTWCGWNRIWFNDILGQKLKEICEKEIDSRVEQRVNEIISDEKILDKLVERIKKKQLK